MTFRTFSTAIQPKIDAFVDYFWPIKASELPKFACITLLMFCILGIQNLVRALKDSIVNTLIGTETVAFLKFWGVMPAAFLITILYVKLVNSMKSETIFYFIISIFLTFFIIFAFYIFPNYQSLHLNSATAQSLIASYPHFKWFVLLLSNWSFSLFYVVAELWPNAVYSLLFWQFVNMITNVEESKRFYLLFGLFGQTGLYISGKFLENISHISNYFANLFNINSDIQVLSIQIMLSVVFVLGVCAMLVFWILNHKILDHEKLDKIQFKIKQKKMTLSESIKMILSSRYILLITVMLICYGIAINMVEGPWKSNASKIYTNPTEFSAFVGSYLSKTGLLTILFVIIGSNIVRKLGWFCAAMITPIMVFVTGMSFFIVTNFDSVAGSMIMFFALTEPSLIAINIGAIQNVISKSSKYTLFDSTKEMSYVPLDDDLKTKGKAAADVIGVKLGKSASAFIQSMIFVIIPSATYSSISVYLMAIFAVICCIWIWGVIELNKEYSKFS